MPTDSLGAGPWVALLAIAALGLVLRWTFGGSQPTFPTQSTEGTDFGLLEPVAVVDSADEAQAVRARLADASIRATTSIDSSGRHRVLVFAADLDRARATAAAPAQDHQDGRPKDDEDDASSS